VEWLEEKGGDILMEHSVDDFFCRQEQTVIVGVAQAEADLVAAINVDAWR
jgi:hypothetical protein